jgi:hypothetical protein
MKDADLSMLTSDEVRIVRRFEAELRRAREEDFAPLYHHLYFLTLLRDGMADLNAELRQNAAAPGQSH